ncbi:HD domain-containing protein [Mycolicibacterium sp. Y3]
MSGALIDRARRLAQVHLGGLLRRWGHVEGVAGAAESVRGHFDTATGDALVAAAWLHDIGYAPSVRVTGFHPLDGARFVRSQGFPDVVASLVAFHSGAAAEAGQRGISGLAEFGEPAGDVLDALTFCDLTTGPDGSVVSAEDRLDEVLRRYGPADPVHRAVDEVRGELLAAVGRVRSWS